MPAPKSYLDKVVFAIRTLKDSKGSSRQAIAKYLKQEFDASNAPSLRKALKTGVSKGILLQDGARFTVKGERHAEKDDGFRMTIRKEGNSDGDKADVGDTVTVSYKGCLKDGTQFDAAKKFVFALGAGEVIKGWDRGVKGMFVGGSRTIVVPPALGYGKRGSPPEIPPNAELHFEIKLLESLMTVDSERKLCGLVLLHMWGLIRP